MHKLHNEKIIVIGWVIDADDDGNETALVLPSSLPDSWQADLDILYSNNIAFVATEVEIGQMTTNPETLAVIVFDRKGLNARITERNRGDAGDSDEQIVVDSTKNIALLVSQWAGTESPAELSAAVLLGERERVVYFKEIISNAPQTQIEKGIHEFFQTPMIAANPKSAAWVTLVTKATWLVIEKLRESAPRNSGTPSPLRPRDLFDDDED